MKKYLFLLTLSLLVVFPAAAALVPACATNPSGPTCTVCDIVSAAISVANLLSTGLSGVVLLMFVVGGFCMIISRGNEELVTKGRKIITGAVIGIVIVTFAWVIVNTVLRVLVKGSLTESGYVQILSGTWWSPTCSDAKVGDCNAKDASGNYYTVGTACDNCSNNGIQGKENCFCHKNTLAQDLADNKCGGSSCTCISLCEDWARTYSTYAGYQCYSSITSNPEGNIFGQDSAASSRDCIDADVCPRQENGSIQAQCCK